MRIRLLPGALIAAAAILLSACVPEFANPLAGGDAADPAVIGTWNAKGNATWACAPGDWIIAEVSLVQEQADDSDDGDDGEGGGGDRVAMLLAVWRIEEGAAAAVLHREDRELLRTLIGLSAWPKLDQRSEVWYGE
jgi:hypothetical protein